MKREIKEIPVILDLKDPRVFKVFKALLVLMAKMVNKALRDHKVTQAKTEKMVDITLHQLTNLAT